MKIRHACHDDLDTIMSVYQHAKKVMEQSGNPGQWVNGYPSRELIEGDLRKERLFVLENDGQVEAVFVYFIGDEPAHGGRRRCPDRYAARSAAHRAFRLICHPKTPAPPVLCGRGRKEGKPLWIFCGMP